MVMLYAAGVQAEIIMDGGEINFTGRVVSQPCVVAPDSADIDVDMGRISKQDLLQNGKSQTKNFSIRLTNCNTSTVQSVRVTFSGNEDSKLPGRLDITGDADGAAIRLLNQDGSAIIINNPAQGIPLNDGENTLNFGAYLEAQPATELVTGNYAASANFILSYQ
ncbi:hypothetical protein NG42_16065 [Winslowiella iniecta]|uniref:Fimbrial-type adhesion domain-containing protein n=1 Tax=Winslowiella iniecta TaxID=1560201 RepID=A0A0L7T5A2_9GAMM|nr:hypothetical protein NG42_16065 [Winslowiella iniecta]KOC90587.1 hypothetical protein NG43_16925 [Winslowiella iniecta]